MAIPGGEESNWYVRDRWTGGHVATAESPLCIASRGKNRKISGVSAYPSPHPQPAPSSSDFTAVIAPEITHSFILHKNVIQSFTYPSTLKRNLSTTTFNARVAVDMDIHGYIHVWISDLGHPVDRSMDIYMWFKSNDWHHKFGISVISACHRMGMAKHKVKLELRLRPYLCMLKYWH